MPDIGCHVAVADEPFSILMKEWGVERADDIPKDDRNMDWFKFLIKLKGKEVKGKSSFKNRFLPHGRAEEYKFKFARGQFQDSSFCSITLKVVCTPSVT
jgi:hypothetical protein